MSLTDEIERFRVEALGKVYHDLEIIEGFTGFVRDMDDARARAMERLTQVVTRGPEPPQYSSEPLAPWPVNQSPTGYPEHAPAGLGPPPPEGYDGYAPPPPPPGYYNGNGAGNGVYQNGAYPSGPPPMPQSGMPVFMGKESQRR